MSHFPHRKISIRCYDNGGKTADRYTVVFSGKYHELLGGSYVHLGMSEDPFHPQGVGTFGESDNHIDNRGYGQTGGYSHLGKRIDFDSLPEKCQKLVKVTSLELGIIFTSRQTCVHVK